MSYVFLALGFAAVSAVCILWVYIPIIVEAQRDRRLGLRFSGMSDTEQSKKHYLRLIQRARKRFDVVCGVMRPAVWDDDFADALKGALKRHKGLQVRILTGPKICRLSDDTHRVWDFYQTYKKADQRNPRFEIRHLKDYPHVGQFRHADGDLYIELSNEEGAAEHPFVTFYKAYVPDPPRVRETLRDFEVKWAREYEEKWGSVRAPQAVEMVRQEFQVRWEQQTEQIAEPAYLRAPATG